MAGDQDIEGEVEAVVAAVAGRGDCHSPRTSLGPISGLICLTNPLPSSLQNHIIVVYDGARPSQ